MYCNHVHSACSGCSAVFTHGMERRCWRAPVSDSFRSMPPPLKIAVSLEISTLIALLDLSRRQAVIFYCRKLQLPPCPDCRKAFFSFSPMPPLTLVYSPSAAANRCYFSPESCTLANNINPIKWQSRQERSVRHAGLLKCKDTS